MRHGRAVRRGNPLLGGFARGWNPDVSLRVTGIRFRNFRSYPQFELGGIGALTVLVGPNAVGKTNVVEGIQLLTALDSFRDPTTDQLITWGFEQASLSAKLEDGRRELEVGLLLDARGRHYRLNGKQRPRAELQGQLPAVMFTPDDLQLVKGGPASRRAALDALGAQVSRNYLAVKRDYEKLLRQKNRLLRDSVIPGYLASVNEVLVKIGSQLILYRLRLLAELREALPVLHGEITGAKDAVELGYLPSFAPDAAGLGELLERYGDNRALVERDFHEMLSARAEEEAARHASLVGPHRDKPVFFLNGRPAADFASQGQQRSIAIAYKLSELRIIERLTGQMPILLLDDVMSELDAARRETLTRYVCGSSQTFITTTNLEYFTPELLRGANVVSLPVVAGG